MSSVADLPLSSLPEPLREPVALAWSAFCAKSESTRPPAFPAPIAASLCPVWAASRFVAGQCARRPELLLDLIAEGRLLRAHAEGECRDLLNLLLRGVATEAELMAVLRRFRNREMVRIAWRDIAGWADLDETLRDLSLLAETCVRAALDFQFRQACARRGTPLNRKGEPQTLVVLGMGKLGARELNFSSDIDLIFAYRDDGVLADKRETSHAEFYTKLAQSLVKVLDATTEDGFVFRVDTRLRPFGESGPPVLSFGAMEAYYESQAREWERYAMVKARAIAGDFEAGRELEEFLRPFVYRRYLDYRAIGEVRELKRKISQELQRKDRLENVKLGPGGIREIEFIGQAFQLVRGGREKRLQERRIQAVLPMLVELRQMESAEADGLLRAYRYLRTVENRLQQYDDRQTHDLPANPLERLNLAHALGQADWESFKRELDGVRAEVQAIFDEVFSIPQGETPEEGALTGNPESLEEELHSLGWPEPTAGAAVLRDFLASRPIRNLTARGETELHRLLPKLLRTAACAESPGAVLLDRLLGLLAAFASRNVYFTLLTENPPALEQLVKLAAASPWLCNYIARYPLLLDELVDPRSLYTPLSKAELQQELRGKLAALDPNDLEQVMLVLRQFKQANVLRVAAADLSGAIPVRVVSDYLTWIAETAVEAALNLSWRITAGRHGLPPGVRPDRTDGFAVIAYGKMGGIELGYGSDLDLVFLYDGAGTAPTTGAKPVTTAEFHARVGKRIIHLITTNTSSGMLYELDLRLRPSGNSGLLVCGLEAYETYQMESAWTWEQQASVKARCVAGDPRVGEKFAAIRAKSLCRARDVATLRAEVREMREKMRENLGSKDPARFDVKHDSGGIVDIEFLVQFGVLSGAHTRVALAAWTDVVRLLETLAAVDFIRTEDARILHEAYCRFRERTHRAALQETPSTVPSGEYAELRSQVRRIWRDVMER